MKRKMMIGLGIAGVMLFLCCIMAMAQSWGLIAPVKPIPTLTPVPPTKTAIPAAPTPTVIPTHTPRPTATAILKPTEVPTIIMATKIPDCIKNCMGFAECWYGPACPKYRCDYYDALELLDDSNWDAYKRRVRGYENLICPKICSDINESDKPYFALFCIEID